LSCAARVVAATWSCPLLRTNHSSLNMRVTTRWTVDTAEEGGGRATGSHW
jgi:hypothetical protein